jgi:hypothetical protein
MSVGSSAMKQFHAGYEGDRHGLITFRQRGQRAAAASLPGAAPARGQAQGPGTRDGRQCPVAPGPHYEQRPQAVRLFGVFRVAVGRVESAARRA